MTKKSLNEIEQEHAERMRDLEENLKAARTKTEEATVKFGRSLEEIMFLAATKTAPAPVINRTIELGASYIGENRVQELCDRLLLLSPCDRQFIGHSQTNKVKSLIGQVSSIQPVDNEKFTKETSCLPLQNKTTTNVLIEVNIRHKENKSGVLPEKLSELPEKVSYMPGISVRGPVTIPPVCDHPEDAMPYFSRMYEYYVDIKAKRMDNIFMDYLSMGMPSDYAQAIFCGANIVRVGSSLFGLREYQILQNENRETSE